jgi:peroxiredoxin
MFVPGTESVTIGAPAPEFALPIINGGHDRTVRLSELRGQVVVIDFWSHECPWSRRYDPYFAERVSQWAGQGVHFFAINSNANETDEAVRAMLVEHDLPFTVLRDAGNLVADAYGAVTTPHVYVVDRDGKLFYRGAVDDRTFRQQEATVNYLDEALNTLLSGNSPAQAETQARGCTIVREFKD